MNKAPYNRRSIHKDVSHLPLDQIQYAITPPLLEEEIAHCRKSDEKNLTNYAGKVCEDLVKSYCAENRWNVAEPEIDMGIDLLINRSDRWDKVQVKKVVFWETDYGLMTQKFQFQSGGISKDVRLRHRQSSPVDFDSFIHVLSTPYRQLIFETPVDQIPLKIPSKAPKQRFRACAVIRNDQSLIFNKRTEKALLEGLWEFPSMESDSMDHLKEKLEKYLMTNHGITVSLGDEFHHLDHRYTSYKTRVSFYEVKWEGPRVELDENSSWVKISKVKDLALPSPYRKFINWYMNNIDP